MSGTAAGRGRRTLVGNAGAGRLADLAGRAGKVVAGFDWPTVAARVVEVYATAIEASPRMVADLD